MEQCRNISLRWKSDQNYSRNLFRLWRAIFSFTAMIDPLSRRSTPTGVDISRLGMDESLILESILPIFVLWILLLCFRVWKIMNIPWNAQAKQQINEKNFRFTKKKVWLVGSTPALNCTKCLNFKKEAKWLLYDYFLPIFQASKNNLRKLVQSQKISWAWILNQLQLWPSLRISGGTSIFMSGRKYWPPYIHWCLEVTQVYFYLVSFIRPYMKWLSRQVENNLRSAEILYTMAWNKAEQRSHKNFVVLFEHIYAGLVKARRNLALFQHHDAITGNFGSVVVIVFIYILFL